MDKPWTIPHFIELYALKLLRMGTPFVVLQLIVFADIINTA